MRWIAGIIVFVVLFVLESLAQANDEQRRRDVERMRADD
jgi:hypothetical protein